MGGSFQEVRLPEAWQDYRVTGYLGQGSYGKVYKVKKPDGTLCAMKIIPFKGHSREPDFLTRLKGEQGIVRILDYCLVEGREDRETTLYILMEHLLDLPAWTVNHVIKEDQIITMLIDLLEGLTACSKSGILHRDIKPENILVTEEGNARLGDFGIARILDQDKENLTRRGTVHYMAPEVYQGKKCDHRSDLYSLALVFYHLVNDGRPPFLDPDLQIPDSGARREALRRRMKGEALPAPSKASRELGRILRKACAYHPHDRYQSAEAMKRALTRLEADRDRNKSKKSFWVFPLVWTRSRRMGLALLTLLLLTVAGLRYWYGQPVFSKEDDFLGASYILYRDGTLVVSGHGSFNLGDLHGMEGIIRKIVFQGGISYIGLAPTVHESDKDGLLAETVKNVREVILQEGVRCIQPYTFSYFSGLEKVTLPSSLEYIGDHAFCGCVSLEEITLPDKIHSLPQNLFFRCIRLRAIHLPAHLSSIGHGAFDQTPWWSERKNKPGYTLEGDVLISYKGDEKEIEIPEDLGICIIGPQAFSECDQLQSVKVPDTVERIEAGAFSGCTELRQIRLPEKLDEISYMAFADCRKMKKIRLPSGVKRIEDSAFMGCSSLEEVEIPDSLERIGSSAFEGTPFLERHRKDGFAVIKGILLSYEGSESQLRIPENLGIRGIADGALARLMHLKSVVIPEGVTWLGNAVFSGCINLEEIHFPSTLSSIEDGIASLYETKWLKESFKKGDPVIINDMLVGYVPFLPADDGIVRISPELPIRGIMRVNISAPFIKKLIIPDKIKKIDKDAFRYLPESMGVGCKGHIYWIEEVVLPDTFSEQEIREIFEGSPWYYTCDKAH